jgi:acetylglutamate synthase
MPIMEPAMDIAPKAAGITAHRGYEGLDTGKIKSLLERSFCKIVAPGFFDIAPKQVIIADDFSGIAIIKSVAGVPYLDKLAVSPEGQGKGLGQALWERIMKDNPELVWRASATNPANGWYLRLSDGAINTGEWIVFWYGMDAQAAKEIVPAVASMPKTMI